jgi:dipeptidyl aminopeptidase/acylaminoacyl peptidase
MFNRLLIVLLASLAVGISAAHAVDATLPPVNVLGVPLPPAEDFARHGTLGAPELSPDGEYIAVSVREPKGDKSDYQLAVLHVPDLKPVSRLDMAPDTIPLDIVWVSNTRVVVGLGIAPVGLEQPAATGEIVAVDFDGKRKRTINALSVRGGTAIKVQSAHWPSGSANIAGLPPKRDGSFYMSLYPYGMETSMIYRVDTLTGSGESIGEISADGMSFVVFEGVARFAYGENEKNDLIVFNRAGKDAPWVKLGADRIGKSFTPLRLTADGKKVYSLSNPSGGPDQFALSDLDGGNREVLAQNERVSIENVIWTPEPRKPIGVIVPDGRPTIQWLDEQDPYAKIIKALNAQFPDHFVNAPSMSQDGSKMLIAAASDKDEATFALFDKATMNLRPLYQEQPWMKTESLGERRPIRFKASSGTELLGYLTLPPGRDAKKLPLVMLPHGGPIGVSDSWFYDPDSQFLATRGYAVLQLNYRGSGGRGDNFQRSGYREMGTGMQQDMIDAVQWAVDQGYVDKERVCVYGASYGGYSALMQPIRAPKLYKCAIDFAGVYDLRLESSRSETRRSRASKNFMDQAWGSNDDAYTKANSPNDLFDKFNVPVLIIHGEEDRRVPVQNAKQLRAALDKADKPYEWMVREKEQHGFFAEKNNADRYRIMEAFLAKYIGDSKH